MGSDAESQAEGQSGASDLKRVAIACQGGGIHAAFAVGVLTEILADLERKRFDLIGISGTSAGALCALMVWYGLAKKNGKTGSPREASKRLTDFWKIFAADNTPEKLLNLATYSAYKFREIEAPRLGLAAPVFRLNPRGAITQAVTAALPLLGVRREYFDLETLLKEACPEFEGIQWDDLNTRLLVGATDVLNGIEAVFDSQSHMSHDNQFHRRGKVEIPEPIWRKRLKLSLNGIAASGSLPELRQGEQIDGRCYWDGLYSLNPPIREFWEDVNKGSMPNEIWVIRINPQQMKYEPQSHAEIEDRQNELMGNLALNKELDFIAHMNMLLKYENRRLNRKAGDAPGFFGEVYEPVTIRTIKMTAETAARLRYSTKFDRSRRRIEELRTEGRAVAREWLNQWPERVDSYPEDVGYWPPQP